jgi:putative photosynthetic complex assembly protein 2
MSIYALPIVYTLFAWWFSTGLILYLDGLPKKTFRWSLVSATALLGGALCGLAVTSNDTSISGAYVAFTCGLLVWGWQEMSFLMGFVTGPRQAPCPPGCSEWHRLGYAIQTILYHELALIASAAAVLSITWRGDNQVGAWTFLVLWVMRQSAKLNLFFGVRNLSEEFLPEHLRYLESYFRRRPMNLLWPVSVTTSSMVAILLWRRASALDTTLFEATGLAFAGTLLTLAIVEHWFLVSPSPATLLWKWGLQSRATREPSAVEAQPGLVPMLIENKAELSPPVMHTKRPLQACTPKL